MLDINLFRTSPELIKKSQTKRHNDPDKIDEVNKLDKQWRENLKVIENLRKIRNEKTEEMARLLKEKNSDKAEILRQSMKDINAQIKDLEIKVENLKEQRDLMLWNIPNIVDDSVPDGKDENDNVPIRFWGKAKVHKDDVSSFLKDSNNSLEYVVLDTRPISHVDLIENWNMGDILRAGKVAGARFYYLKNELLLLELALEQFALELLKDRGFEIVEPPFMLTYKAEHGATDFSAFQDTLYKIENEDLYLIPTSEHAIAAMYMDEILDENRLPMRIAGYSPCFRKEAGAHGKDTKGIFRVHQFFKVEQFVFCDPGESEQFFNELINNAEIIFQKLNLPYRVVTMCAGDLGNMVAKKQDIEVWMPAQGKFREVVSCANLKDYQARRLNVRVRKNNEHIFVHTLNSTAIATTRTLVAILENYQTEEGIEIPKVLQKYLSFDSIKKMLC